MASSTVSSRGRSPHSPYDINSDTDESWQYLEYASSGGSIGFLPSPASGSLSGFAIVGPVGAVSPGAASPFHLDVESQFPATNFPDRSDAFTATSAHIAESVSSLSFRADSVAPDAFMTPQGLLGLTDAVQLSQLSAIAADTSFFSGYEPNMPLAPEATLRNAQPDLGISQSFQANPNEPAWDPDQMKNGPFVIEQFVAPSSASSSVSPALSGKSSSLKFESETPGKPPSPIRKVKVGKIEKKKPLQQEQAGKFVIMTPNSINARAGKPNPFECFEALRTQRGRKGPLANDTKQSALQVRRLGACFCCHARKVRCDKERPCKSCTKLMIQVPQIVCWQFQDFIPVLFPEFIRGHFKKDEMNKFITENIESFTVNGVEQPCAVQLFSGSRFDSVLSIRAKFFTAKTAEVLQHWHMHVAQDGINLHSQSAAPMGLDSESAAQKDEIKKKAKEYIQSIMKEPAFAEQLAESFRHTDLPQRILHIIQNYALQSENPIVRKALAVYTSHYIMTRHLCLTRQTIQNLRHTNLVAQNLPWVTPRVLNRQVKAVMDEITLKDMTSLFEQFSKSLKPKSRKSWAPCLAAFLVLCLFMEAVETAADNFVISQAEINLQKHFAPEFQRDQALQVNREIERLPFKQFAYQFHQIYQTHSKDVSTKSFNPLVDDSFAEQGELDAPAVEMVNCLRQFLQGPSWDELDFLTADPILPNQENHPFPRDVSINYTGRLVSKFLLSFTDERYIFEGGF